MSIGNQRNEEENPIHKHVLTILDRGWLANNWEVM
jgi:hypothetical protein